MIAIALLLALGVLTGMAAGRSPARPDMAAAPGPAGVAAPAALPGPASTVARKRRTTYCTKRRRPPGCVKVPKHAKRPARISQQGGPALTPPETVNGGGLGGGPGNHRSPALTWARSQIGQARWSWRCERFVEEAYGTRAKFDTAAQAAAAMDLHHGSPSSAPAGSLMYFAADKYNRGWGHVGISLGRGRMVSALTKVERTNVVKTPYWRKLYLGWAEAPANWPGRIPPPPGPTTLSAPTPGAFVQITAPAANSTQSGVLSLRAVAPSAGGVVFDVYYASDPRAASTRQWHVLGNATPNGDAWQFDFDTTAVPDQGFGAWGTVNVAATALDADGRRTAVRDYRRITIDNHTNSVVPTTPTTTATIPTTPPPVGQTWTETAGGAANTWSDYTSAGGTAGPRRVGAQEAVQISCRVQGFRVADGNTWWYRIASSPWNDQFYVSADAFYNNGQTSGSLSGTPFVDPAVAPCP